MENRVVESSWKDSRIQNSQRIKRERTILSDPNVHRRGLNLITVIIRIRVHQIDLFDAL